MLSCSNHPNCAKAGGDEDRSLGARPRDGRWGPCATHVAVLWPLHWLRCGILSGPRGFWQKGPKVFFGLFSLSLLLKEAVCPCLDRPQPWKVKPYTSRRLVSKRGRVRWHRVEMGAWKALIGTNWGRWMSLAKEPDPKDCWVARNSCRQHYYIMTSCIEVHVCGEGSTRKKKKSNSN